MKKKPARPSPLLAKPDAKLVASVSRPAQAPIEALGALMRLHRETGSADALDAMQTLCPVGSPWSAVFEAYAASLD